MYEIAPSMGSDILYDVLRESERLVDKPDRKQESLHASLRCLAILADVTSLCLQRADHSATTSQFEINLQHLSRAERWKRLWDELKTWRATCPLELQSLAHHERAGASFPTILFTSWAGLSTNIIYHTAMFLLLDHRPRTGPKDDSFPLDTGAAYVSPIWHARRICGIALSSDLRYRPCWDPCMIAAFTLVARRMTHPDQQTELLKCVQGMKASGWRVDGLTTSLRRDWGLFDPDIITPV